MAHALPPARGMVIHGFRVGPLLKKTAKEIGADNVSTLAAQTAYYFFFSLFPLFLFFAPLLSLVMDRETLVSLVTDRLAGTLPPEAIAPLRLVVDNLVNTTSAPALISLGVLLAAWSGSNVFGALMTALNTAYDVEETRSWIKRLVLRLLMLVAGGVITIGATIVMLGGEDIARGVGHSLGLGERSITIWNLIQFPVAFVCLVLFAFLTYWILPNVRQKKSHALIASLVAVTLWVAATMLFRLYVQRFPPNPVYGLVGGVMILLTWMYYTMFVVLAGGELASEMHHGSGAVDPPKGATFFSRIVSGDDPGAPSTIAG